MLEDTLAQVFATVLVGILVFLTIERRFESLDEKGTTYRRWWNRARTNLKDAQDKLEQLQLKRKNALSRVLPEHERKKELSEIDTRIDVQQRIKNAAKADLGTFNLLLFET